ncbi:mitochondrial ubiquitin ligase activator of NFKB 1-like [Sycon ciliatum]|uniref:mitochondrial ubiquitin ligase activator of NFKB 1-like n=1 Tax=Sycon ciliatum TaxID=27933 RepID=UPI0031F6AFC4
METIDWVVGGVLGFTGLAFYAGSSGFSSAARAVEDAEEMAPGPKMFERLQHEQSRSLPYAAVSGYIQPSEEHGGRVLTYGSGNIPCVVRRTITKEHSKDYSRGTDRWHGSTKEVSRAIQTVPFSLSSSASSGSSVDSHAVQVHAAEADYSQVLTKVESRFDHVDRGVGASILSVVSGHKTTGYEYIEEVLPVAQFVTVLGKVSLVQNSLVLESPTKHQLIFTTDSLADLSSRYYSRSRILGALASLCFAGLSLYALHRLRTFMIEQQRAELIRDALASRKPKFCIKCMKQPATMLVLECRHFAVCEKCAPDLQECPACTTPATQVTLPSRY